MKHFFKQYIVFHFLQRINQFLFIFVFNRGRLRCVLFSLHVYISRFRNGHIRISMDWWLEECWWCLRKEWRKKLTQRLKSRFQCLILNHSLFLALSRFIKITEHRHCNTFELWKTCAAGCFTCYIGTWNRPQFWFTGKF